MVLLRAEHPMKYSENDYNEKHAECPAGMSISQSSPHHVDPKLGVMFNPDEFSVIGLHLQVEQGRSYLVDFLVRPSDSLNYRLRMSPGEYVYEDLGGSYNHVLATVTSKSAGWTNIALDSDSGKMFRFFGVSVTSVDESLISIR